MALKIPLNENNFFNPPPNPAAGIPGRPFRKRKVIIYFIGGITYGEIAAVKFLEVLYPKYKFIIATTSIINGETAVEQLCGPGLEETGL